MVESVRKELSFLCSVGNAKVFRAIFVTTATRPRLGPAQRDAHTAHHAQIMSVRARSPIREYHTGYISFMSILFDQSLPPFRHAHHAGFFGE